MQPYFEPTNRIIELLSQIAGVTMQPYNNPTDRIIQLLVQIAQTTNDPYSEPTNRIIQLLELIAGGSGLSQKKRTGIAYGWVQSFAGVVETNIDIINNSVFPQTVTAALFDLNGNQIGTNLVSPNINPGLGNALTIAQSANPAWANQSGIMVMWLTMAHDNGVAQDLKLRFSQVAPTSHGDNAITLYNGIYPNDLRGKTGNHPIITSTTGSSAAGTSNSIFVFINPNFQLNPAVGNVAGFFSLTGSADFKNNLTAGITGNYFETSPGSFGGAIVPNNAFFNKLFTQANCFAGDQPFGVSMVNAKVNYIINSLNELDIQYNFILTQSELTFASLIETIAFS